GQRLDRLADLKKLTADYQRQMKDRPPSEGKRLEQLAADRQSSDRAPRDRLLAIDSSPSARGLEELLGADYREIIEIGEEDGNLKKQREKVEELVELTRKESAALAGALPLLAKQVARLRVAREEETVLARARLRPEQADELLKGYQMKTGRLLPKPVP